MTYFERICMLSAFNLDLYKWVIFMLATDPYLSLDPRAYKRAKCVFTNILLFLEASLFVFQFINVYQMMMDRQGIQIDKFFKFLYIIFLMHIVCYLIVAFLTHKRLKTLYLSFYLQEKCYLTLVLFSIVFCLFGMSVISYLQSRNDFKESLNRSFENCTLFYPFFNITSTTINLYIPALTIGISVVYGKIHKQKVNKLK